MLISAFPIYGSYSICVNGRPCRYTRSWKAPPSFIECVCIAIGDGFHPARAWAAAILRRKLHRSLTTPSEDARLAQ